MAWICPLCKKSNDDSKPSLMTPLLKSSQQKGFGARYCQYCYKKVSPKKQPQQELLNLTLKHNGTLKLWVQQGEDKTLQEEVKSISTKMILLSNLFFNSNSIPLMGLCYAITHEWIKQALWSDLSSFRDEFSGGEIPKRFVSMQHDHLKEIEKINLEVDIREKSDKELKKHNRIIFNTNKNISKEEYISFNLIEEKNNIIEEISTSLQRSGEKTRKMVIGHEALKNIAVGKDIAVGIFFEDARQFKDIVMENAIKETGPYTIIFGKDMGSGHVIALEYKKKTKWRLFDSNTGEFCFGSAFSFFSFLKEYFSYYYESTYKNGVLSIVRFTLL